MTKVLQQTEKSNKRYETNAHSAVINRTDGADDVRLFEETYRFKSRRKNPDWDLSKLIPLRPCHIHNKAEISEDDVYVSKTPKWLTVLEKESIDLGTGEIVYSDYETDDFKAARNRKIKTVEKFCDYYEPLYHRREVSLLFHTFTRINYAKQDMRSMLDNVKYRYRSLGREIRGYIWVLEVSEYGHVHYHLIVAVDRVRFKRIPKALKFEDLWGQRTGVEFIRKSIKSYLTKYLYKSDTRLLRKRSYAISRKLT